MSNLPKKYTILLRFKAGMVILLLSLPCYGQILDTIKWKLEEYRNSNDIETKVILSNEIMELDYALSIEEALQLKNEYETKARDNNDASYQMVASLVMADVYYYKNKLDSSFYYYFRQAQIGEQLNDYQSSVAGYVNAAYVIEIEGKFIEAKELIKKAERVARLGSDEINMSSGYFNLALIFHKMGQPDSASYYIKKVIELDRFNDNLSGMVHNLQFLVDLELRSGRIDDAREYCNECLEMSRKADYHRGEGMCNYSMAYVEYQDKNMGKALEYIDKSIRIYLERKDSTRMGRLVRLKANITAGLNPSKAENLYSDAVNYGQKSGNILQLCKTGIDFAKFYLNQNQPSKGEKMIGRIQEWSADKDFQDIEEELFDLRYNLATKKGNLVLANDILEEKDRFKEEKIKELIESQSNSANQYYEIFQMERELQDVAYQNQINQLEAKRKANIYISVGGLLFLTSILGYLAFQNQKNKNVILKKSAQEEKLISNNQILEKELDALRSQMNPHFLFNSLNSINDYIMHQEPRLASKYLTKFSRLMRTILNNSKKKFITIQEEVEAIKLYMEMEQIRFGDKFDFRMDIDQNIDSESLLIPAMLIQPYLENSVKHGIKHLESKGYISVSIIGEDDNRIRVEIKDNGIGRTKSMKIKNHLDKQRKSYGMEITSDRVDILNQIYKVNASIEYIDHIDPSGTEVIISLQPIKNSETEWKKSEQ